MESRSTHGVRGALQGDFLGNTEGAHTSTTEADRRVCPKVPLGAGSCPTEVKADEFYAVLDLGKEILRNGEKTPVGLLLRAPTTRQLHSVAGGATKNPDILTMPMSHYGVAVQLALIGVGGLSSMTHTNTDIPYFDLQADALRTRLFDFGMVKMYDFQANVVWGWREGAPPPPFGNGAKGYDNIARRVEEAEVRLSSFVHQVILRGGNLFREQEIIAGVCKEHG